VIENQVLEEFGDTGGEKNWAIGGWRVGSLPGLCMGIMVAGFQHEGKVWEDQDQLKRERCC